MIYKKFFNSILRFLKSFTKKSYNHLSKYFANIYLKFSKVFGLKIIIEKLTTFKNNKKKEEEIIIQ